MVEIVFVENYDLRIPAFVIRMAVGALVIANLRM
jgi:hypothetical protein